MEEEIVGMEILCCLQHLFLLSVTNIGENLISVQFKCVEVIGVSQYRWQKCQINKSLMTVFFYCTVGAYVIIGTTRIGEIGE